MDQAYRYAPFQFQPPREMTLSERLRMFLGHHDLRVFLTEQAYIDVDRGSLDAALQVRFVADHHVGLIGSVGQFCDISNSATLFGGGQHRNDQPVNVVMANIPMFRSSVLAHNISELREAPHKPFQIGHGVVISDQVSVLPGASIGNGTIIAASSVVTGPIDAFTIAVGVPARVMRPRVSEEVAERLTKVRWWDFETVYLGNLLSRLQEAALDTQGKHVYSSHMPRLCVRLSAPPPAASSVQIVGFLDGGQMHKVSEMPAVTRRYLEQLSTAGPYFWVPNMWGV